MNTEREKKQLEKLLAERRPRPIHYLGIAMLLLTIVYIVDEITSNMNSSMQPYALFELFNITSRDVNSPEYANAINVVAPLSVISLIILLTKVKETKDADLENITADTYK